MKIQFMSDLHLEFEEGPHFPDRMKLQLPECERDLLVLAGDIHLGTRSLGFIRKQLKQSPVAYVLGNHEFYQHDYVKLRKQWKKLALEMPGFILLDDSTHVLPVGGERLLLTGGTLWTNMNNEDPVVMNTLMFGMSDYYVITHGGKKFTPDHALEAHYKTMEHLDDSLEEHLSNVDKSIVVSHMAPHRLSCSDHYNNELNDGYYSDLSAFIERHQPDLWIHGHIHESRDYMVGRTRVVSNPRGYVGHGPFGGENPSFDSGRVIEV